MQDIIIVNACNILSDVEVQAMVAPLQRQIDEHFLPHWAPHGVQPAKLSFATIRDISNLPATSWPISGPDW